MKNRISKLKFDYAKNYPLIELYNIFAFLVVFLVSSDGGERCGMTHIHNNLLCLFVVLTDALPTEMSSREETSEFIEPKDENMEGFVYSDDWTSPENVSHTKTVKFYNSINQ